MPSSSREHDHHYETSITWTGNTGEGTKSLRSYEKSYDIEVPGKPVIAGSSDPAFRGDPTRYNPEDLLVASLSACHMLWYLSLSAKAKIVVTSYVDRADGTMVEDESGSGHFSQVVLRPEITVAFGTDLDRAHALHHDAHAMCFVANSVNFPVTAEPIFTLEDE
ncbi:MAG: OsmC family protein [Thermomicrobiales bacterium]